jgi:hypothetical protein
MLMDDSGGFFMRTLQQLVESRIRADAVIARSPAIARDRRQVL